MEVKNTTSSSNKITQSMCTTLNSWVWGKDYIKGQLTAQKFGKQIDPTEFICKCICDLPTLQNLNVMEAEDQCVQLEE